MVKLAEKGREFTCERCKKTFIEGHSPEEALEEYSDNFGGEPADDAAIICEDCYQLLKKDLTWLK